MDTLEQVANGVTIDLSRYEELIVNECERNYLIDCLLNDARLSYNGKFLTFNDETISGFLRLIIPDTYSHKLKTLNEEKEKTNE